LSTVAYSVPDCRGYATFPNTAINVQQTETYTGQISNNSSVPGTDSRIVKPTDDRTAANIPENSRNPPPF